MPKQRTKTEQEMLCETWKQSGLTKVEFCKQNNIGEKSLYRWLSTLRNSNKTDVTSAKDNIEPPIKFLQISNTISERNFISEKGILEIALPNGVNFKVGISQDCTNNLLQELLKWK